MNSSSSSTSTKKIPISAPLTKSPLFRNWLWIIMATLIIAGLSEGAFPLAWARLTQMLGNWSTLQAASGSAVLVPLAILLLQIVCFLVAWVMLALVIVREALAFIGELGQAQNAPPPANVAGLPAPATPPVEQDVALFPDPAAALPDTSDVDEYKPFDMDAAIFDLQPHPDEARPEEQDEDDLPVPTIVEEETVFVYGDPLAGDLPEIFSYDTDLKRDVQDLRAKARARAQTGPVDSNSTKQNNSDNGHKEEQDEDEETKKIGSFDQENSQAQQDADGNAKKAHRTDSLSDDEKQDSAGRAAQANLSAGRQDTEEQEKSRVSAIDHDEKP